MAIMETVGDTKNTIAGFDSVISISQEAINKQLEVLYKTPVKNPEKKGPRFLIDHEMHFHRLLKNKTGGFVPSKDGLDAYVSCPIIDFSGDKLRDKNERMTTARISFTFRSSLQIDGPGPSGVKSIYFVKEEVVDEDGSTETKYEPKDVTGWTMSWEGKVGQKDIANTLHGSLHQQCKGRFTLMLCRNRQIRLCHQLHQRETRKGRYESFLSRFNLLLIRER